MSAPAALRASSSHRSSRTRVARFCGIADNDGDVARILTRRLHCTAERLPSAAGGRRSRVLLVGDVLAPGHGAAGLVGLLDRHVDHEAVRRGAVPVVLAGLEEDAIA